MTKSEAIELVKKLDTIEQYALKNRDVVLQSLVHVMKILVTEVREVTDK